MKAAEPHIMSGGGGSSLVGIKLMFSTFQMELSKQIPSPRSCPLRVLLIVFTSRLVRISRRKPQL